MHRSFKQNTGSPWRSIVSICLNADVALDFSGRTFAGVVKQQGLPDKIVAGEFFGHILSQNIQI